MDVHAPHEPIHSVKDFLLHLLTITVGLLIAVGIEGCVTLHREHSLVKEARATLREEIEQNAKSMEGATKTVAEEKASITSDLDTLTKILRQPKDKNLQHASIEMNHSIQGLREAAWKTAQTTGALTFMPYAESQKYTYIYEAQHNFLEQQDKVLDDVARFLGTIRGNDFGHGDITPEQASAVLEKLGEAQAHWVYLDLMAKLSLQSDRSFLDGTEGPSTLKEDFDGGK